MVFKECKCPNCGRELKQDQSKGKFKCVYCGHNFEADNLEEVMAAVRATLGGVVDDALLRQRDSDIANARYNLWDAVHEEYIDDGKVLNCCGALKKYSPKDVQANFYETALTDRSNRLNRYIDGIDAKTYAYLADDIIEFILKSLEKSNVLSLKNFVERVYRGDKDKFVKYMTAVEDEAVRLDSGLYVPEIPRDVFLAYSSADMNKVNEIAEMLESQKISCFVAARNLRHGKGAVANYEKYLKTAMHNCKCVVFLSSEKSRDLDCDALKTELPYIRDNEPYMGRIEYVIEEYSSGTSSAAKILLKDFFNGLEYCRTPEDLLRRVLSHITGGNKKESNTKFCVSCGTENPKTAKRCMECGEPNFVFTREEYVEKSVEERLKREYEQKLARMQAEYERLKNINADTENAKQDVTLTADQDSMREEMFAESEENYKKGKSLYDNGNYSKAVEYFEMAAKQGLADAQYNLGVCYYYGDGVAEDEKKAVEYFEMAAKQGLADAQYNLGVCYYYGNGVAVDYKKAVEYFEMAAKQGYAAAQYNLGACYENGDGVAEDEKKAVEYYELAAKQGYADAQYNLGFCYEKGCGVAQDYKKAVEYFEMAAKQGHVDAQYNLGVCYENGYGVAQDYEKAVEYYEMAAKQGHADAQCNLGECYYYYGDGIAEDYKKAVEYYEMAAKQGHADAQCNLGRCYEAGYGVAQDYKKAVEYYELAAKQGDVSAKVCAELLRKQLGLL